MRSSRNDVEKLLGRSKYRGYVASYEVEDGVVHIEYYPFNFCTQTGAYLRVPKWTVAEITYRPDDPATLADLKLDLKKFRKVRQISDVLDVFSYVNNEEGVDYTFHADELINVRYFPGKRHNSLRCKKSQRLR